MASGRPYSYFSLSCRAVDRGISGRRGTGLIRRAAAMRHVMHFCVTFWPKRMPETLQCDTVLARNGARIATIAKKPAAAGTYVQHTCAHEWRMVCTRRLRGNSRLCPENRRKIRNWPKTPELFSGRRACLRREEALCAADSLDCAARRGNSREFWLGPHKSHFPIRRRVAGPDPGSGAPVSRAGLDLRIQEQRPTRPGLVFFPMTG